MLKCTAFFNLGRQGWSETWFRDGNNLAGAMQALKGLLSYRMFLCVPTVTVDTLRVSVVENPKVVLVNEVSLVGLASGVRDVTNAAILWEARTVDYVTRQIWTRGMPDEQLVAGKYAGIPPFPASAQAWGNALSGNNWQIRIQQRGVGFEIVEVESVSGTGLMTTFQDQAYDRSMRFKFFRTRDNTGTAISKPFAISSAPTLRTFQLVGWPAGRTVTIGKGRRYSLVGSNVSAVFLNKVATRKTGRPFGVAAGRRRVA